MTTPETVEALARAMLALQDYDPDADLDRLERACYFVRNTLALEAARQAETKAATDEAPAELMMDDEFFDDVLCAIEPLVRPGHHHTWNIRGDKDLHRGIRKVIEMTRANTRPLLTPEQMEAIVDDAYKRWRMDAWLVRDVIRSAIREALRLAGVAE